MRTMVLLAAVLAVAGCKKTPPDCKKVKDYYCGPNGTPEECEQAKDIAESKNGASCAKTFIALKDARKQKETAAAKEKQAAAFNAERDLRAPIIAEMEQVSANRYELGEKLLTAKGAEKKKIEEEIKVIDAKLNELMEKLNARVQPGAAPAPQAPAPSPSGAP